MFDKVMESVIQKAQENQEANRHKDDYIGNDGLLVCGCCGYPRQMELDVPLIGRRTVPIMCLCDQARREQEEAAHRAWEEMERIRQMRNAGITSEDYRRMTFDQDDGCDPRMAALAHRYVEKRDQIQAENIGLLLHGNTGGGKTFWAASIANAMIDHRCSALITTIPQLVTAMAQDYEQEKPAIIKKLANVRFLVLDDIGFERQTQYAAEKLFEIIDARYKARRPLIVTTNLTMEEIKNPSQMEYKRVFDRIVEMCQPVHVSGEGRRMAIARDKTRRAEDILGL